MKMLPIPPRFTLAVIGPGVVLIAMGLGSGEVILWPYLVTQFGFGILWGALVGITLQYFVSNETGRFTVYSGASVYVGFSQLTRIFPYWFIVSTYLSFAWPGIIGSGGVIFGRLLNIEEHKYITIFMLFAIGLLLTLGGKVYTNLERMQKLFIIGAIPILAIIAVLLITPQISIDVAAGLLGFGDGYFLLPTGISFMSFLGAVAYSGAAGNLVASHSFYLQDEGVGVAKYADSEISIADTQDRNIFYGVEFDQNTENISRFKKTFNLAATEQILSFWLLGLVVIVLLTVIAFALIYPFNGADGLEFIFVEAQSLGGRLGYLLSNIFLIICGVFLFTTQLGIFETTSRIMTENIILAKPKVQKQLSRSSIFFLFLWLQVTSSIIISFLEVSQPLQILLLSTFFSAVSMFVLSIAVLWLNNSRLIMSEVRPGLWRNLWLFMSILFFGVFLLFTLLNL